MSNIKEGFNRYTSTSTDPTPSKELQDVIAKASNNIVLGDTDPTNPSITGIIASPEILDSMHAAGIKHVFIELPNSIDFKIGHLVDGDIDKETFVNSVYDHYKHHRPLSTLPVAQHKQILGNVADIILGSRERGGMQVHFSDFRDDSDRIPPDPEMRIAMTRAKMEFMNEHGLQANDELKAFIKADPARKGLYHDYIHDHMQQNVPEVFGRYQQMVLHKVSSLANATADFVKLTAQDEPFAVQTGRNLNNDNDLDDLLGDEPHTRIDLYYDSAQQNSFDNNRIFTGNDTPDFTYMVVGQQLQSDDTPKNLQSDLKNTQQEPSQ